MNNQRRRDDAEVSFEGVLDLGSIPPAPGSPAAAPADVHAARTAIADLPSELLEELRRGKRDDLALQSRLQRTFQLPRGAPGAGEASSDSAFSDERPTAPGTPAKDFPPALRPVAPRIDEAEEDASPPSGSHCLAAAITAALEPPAHASDPPSIHLAPVIIAPVLDDETLQRMSPPPSRPSVDARVPSSFALEPYVAGAGIAAPPRWRWWHALLALLVVLTLSIAARGLRRG